MAHANLANCIFWVDSRKRAQMGVTKITVFFSLIIFTIHGEKNQFINWKQLKIDSWWMHAMKSSQDWKELAAGKMLNGIQSVLNEIYLLQHRALNVICVVRKLIIAWGRPFSHWSFVAGLAINGEEAVTHFSFLHATWKYCIRCSRSLRINAVCCCCCIVLLFGHNLCVMILILWLPHGYKKLIA